MRQILLSAATALCLATGAHAQDFSQGADPQVVQALNELIGALGAGCNAGNATACQAVPVAQTGAQYMLMHSYQCNVMGDPQGCAAYQQDYADLRTSYAQVEAAHVSGTLYTPTGGGAGMGMTHAQRMQQIQDFGAANTARHNQRMMQMDLQHQQFLDMIRQ